MTGNKVLLDTNIVIELFRGDVEIADFLEKTQNVHIVPAVLAELYLGAYNSGKEEKHLNNIEDFLLKCSILSVDAVTAQKYAVIKTALLRRGTPIPENDIWIAASALQYGLPLYTNDKHFTWIDNLILIK